MTKGKKNSQRGRKNIKWTNFTNQKMPRNMIYIDLNVLNRKEVTTFTNSPTSLRAGLLTFEPQTFDTPILDPPTFDLRRFIPQKIINSIRNHQMS